MMAGGYIIYANLLILIAIIKIIYN